MTDDTRQTIRNYILSEFLRGEDPDELTDATPLISGGILDSIATMKLVMFIEEQYGIVLEPHEVDKENLDSIECIIRLLIRKRAAEAR
jgi:acyl carrier protein